MKLSTLLTTILLLPLISATQHARAEFVVFDFYDVTGAGATGMVLDGLATGDSTVMGITLTAMTGDPSDIFNHVPSSGFGINSQGSSDETDAFDLRGGTSTPEMMTFSFAPVTGNVSLTLKSLKFDRFNAVVDPIVGVDMGSLEHLGGGFATFNFADADIPGNVLEVEKAIAAGDNLRLAYVSGNGFGLQSITLSVTAVPEPSLGVTLNLLCASVWLRRTRRRR